MFFKQKVVNEILKYGLLISIILLIIIYFIVPVYNKSLKKGFIEEINRISKKADEYYVAHYFDFDETNQDFCIETSNFVNSRKYKGAVIFEYNYETHSHDEYIYLSSDRYVFNSHEPYKEVSKDDIVSSKYSDPLYEDCASFN